MNELQIFNSSEFGQIRTVTKDNEPWFVASDICKALELSNPTMAAQRLDEDERSKFNLGRQGEAVIVNEFGLYNLVLASRKQGAKDFKRWITHEVLPSIRKSGGYIAGQEDMSDSELMAKALLVAQKQIEQRNLIIEQQKAQIEADKPKTIFADAVSTSKNSILVGELAKLICQNGVQIGQKRLFQWLRDNGYLIKRKGADWNMPTQKSIEMGLFEIKENTRIDGNGCTITTRTPKATGKTQIYFINKFLERTI